MDKILVEYQVVTVHTLRDTADWSWIYENKIEVLSRTLVDFASNAVVFCPRIFLTLTDRQVQWARCAH